MYQTAVILSLVRKLSFACKVVPAGHIFLCCLLDLSMTVKHLHHHIQIFREAQLDIIWWQDFLPTWSGSSLILDTHWTTSPDIHLYTDVSGSLGWGAFWSGCWLQASRSLNQLALGHWNSNAFMSYIRCPPHIFTDVYNNACKD